MPDYLAETGTVAPEDAGPPPRTTVGGIVVVHDDDSPGRRRARVVAQLFTAAIGLWLVLAATGLLLTRVLFPSGPPAADAEVDGWLAAHRTPLGDALTHVGSSLSDTPTCIAVATIVVIALRLRLGRWYESLVVITAIAGELLVFLAVTATVERARPSVPHLDAAPPTSSFPSGHTAAAIALYGCIAVLAYRRMRPGSGRVVLAIVLFSIPLVVGFSRLYRGMHFPSDVLAGLVGGGLWLLVVVLVLLRDPERERPGSAVIQQTGKIS